MLVFAWIAKRVLKSLRQPMPQTLKGVSQGELQIRLFSVWLLPRVRQQVI